MKKVVISGSGAPNYNLLNNIVKNYNEHYEVNVSYQDIFNEAKTRFPIILAEVTGWNAVMEEYRTIIIRTKSGTYRYTYGANYLRLVK